MSEEANTASQENAIIPATLDSIAAIVEANKNAIADDKTFKAVSKSADYFGRMNLCSSKSQIVEEGKITVNHYALIFSATDFKDLGPNPDVMPLLWRPKALDMNPEVPVSVYDETSAEFIRIMEKSKQSNSKCTWGPEFLVYIPSIKEFGILHFGSPTNRRVAPAFKDRMGKPVTLSSQMIKNSEFTWRGIVVTDCTTPFELPSNSDISAKIEKFKKEAAAKAPEAADAPTSDRPR